MTEAQRQDIHGDVFRVSQIAAAADGIEGLVGGDVPAVVLELGRLVAGVVRRRVAVWGEPG